MEEEEQVAAVARALAHPARVRIVRLLATQTECRGAEVFAELPLAQSTISEHLRILKEAGVIGSRPSGTSTLYCLNPGAFEGLIQTVRDIGGSAVSCATEGGRC